MEQPQVQVQGQVQGRQVYWTYRGPIYLPLCVPTATPGIEFLLFLFRLLTGRVPVQFGCTHWVLSAPGATLPVADGAAEAAISDLSTPRQDYHRFDPAQQPRVGWLPFNAMTSLWFRLLGYVQGGRLPAPAEGAPAEGAPPAVLQVTHMVLPTMLDAYAAAGADPAAGAGPAPAGRPGFAIKYPPVLPVAPTPDEAMLWNRICHLRTFHVRDANGQSFWVTAENLDAFTGILRDNNFSFEEGGNVYVNMYDSNGVLTRRLVREVW
ncbi:MAG: hypothetical protein EBS05_27595 [Proteobacteria bacterium]|nr:hypothetical protein [Pseudomonadota bacterium]